MKDITLIIHPVSTDDSIAIAIGVFSAVVSVIGGVIGYLTLRATTADNRMRILFYHIRETRLIKV